MERSILSSVPPTHPAPDATRYLPGMGKVAQPPSSSEFSTSLYTPSQNRRISSKLCGDALHAAQVHLALWARDNWEQLSVLHAPPPRQRKITLKCDKRQILKHEIGDLLALPKSTRMTVHKTEFFHSQVLKTVRKSQRLSPKAGSFFRFTVYLLFPGAQGPPLYFTAIVSPYKSKSPPHWRQIPSIDFR